MNLKEANKELEKLENEYNYWLREKEQLLVLLGPRSTDIREERVDGGKRVDRLYKYIELEDERKINATLDYIAKRKENLLKWINTELEILQKYGEVESAIIQLKENGIVRDKNTNKYREMTWEEIAEEVHWSKSFCRNVYRNYRKKRDIGY